VRRIFPGGHLRNIRQFRPTDRNQRAAIRAAGLRSAIRAAGLGRLTFSIPVPIPAVAALPAAYKRAADAMPTLPTSHSCRDTSPSCRPLSSSSIAEKLPAGHAPDHSPIIRLVRLAGLVERRGGWRPGRAARRLAAWSSGPAAGSGGLAAVLAVPGREDRRPGGRLFGGSVGGSGRPAAGSGVPGREDRAAGRFPAAPWRAARPGSCQARRPEARQARKPQSLFYLTPCGFDPVDPGQVDPAHGKTRRIRPGLSLADFS